MNSDPVHGTQTVTSHLIGLAELFAAGVLLIVGVMAARSSGDDNARADPGS